MMRVLLVGAGPMAGEHAKVLEALNVDYTVVGRGKSSAENFENTYGKTVRTGSLEKVFDEFEGNYTHAIVATTLESLEENALFLLKKGIDTILLEKPGAVTQEGLERIRNEALNNDANVYIAYNRRFYTSVIEAQKRIADDGGVTSFIFEFTEWSHQIVELKKTKFQLENWFIGNSTHVIDTAFYLGGLPREIQCFNQSKLKWHPKGSIFVGAGITEKNVPFSYHANWGAPGSWKLELLTTKHRYIFRPFEQLHVQKIGSVVVEKVNIEDNQIDLQYKAGLYHQLEQFLTGKKNVEADLLNIERAVDEFYWYKRMLGE